MRNFSVIEKFFYKFRNFSINREVFKIFFCKSRNIRKFPIETETFENFLFKQKIFEKFQCKTNFWKVSMQTEILENFYSNRNFRKFLFKQKFLKISIQINKSRGIQKMFVNREIFQTFL